MARTGIPKLKTALTILVHFIDRNLWRFQGSMSGPQMTATNSCLQAIKDLLALL